MLEGIRRHQRSENAVRRRPRDDRTIGQRVMSLVFGIDIKKRKVPKPRQQRDPGYYVEVDDWPVGNPSSLSTEDVYEVLRGLADLDKEAVYQSLRETPDMSQVADDKDGQEPSNPNE
jgi:hypothetical protein